MKTSVVFVPSMTGTLSTFQIERQFTMCLTDEVIEVYILVREFREKLIYLASGGWGASPSSAFPVPVSTERVVVGYPSKLLGGKSRLFSQ